MKKALTIYIDDDAKLIKIFGTFIVTYEDGNFTSANLINGSLENANACYLPKIESDENPIKFFKEVER